MKGWKWSNGEAVDAKSLLFYMNMAEAEKANWCHLLQGLLPDNVTSYKATGPNQVTFHLNKAYSSLWFTYNQLAELTPMPASWDVTSLSAKPGSGGCISDTKADGWAKCKKVYTFLTAQSKQAATYASSKLWSVVDGPWKLSAFSTTGNVTMVPNKAYSGSPKPELSAVKFVPFTDDATEYTALKTGQLDVGNIPSQDLPPKSASSPCRPPTRSAAATPCSRSTRSASTTRSRTSTTRRSAPWSASCTCARRCRASSTRTASTRRSTAATPSRTRGRRRTSRRAISGSRRCSG